MHFVPQEDFSAFILCKSFTSYLNVLFSTFLTLNINMSFSYDFIRIFISIWLHIIGICVIDQVVRWFWLRRWAGFHHRLVHVGFGRMERHVLLWIAIFPASHHSTNVSYLSTSWGKWYTHQASSSLQLQFSVMASELTWYSVTLEGKKFEFVIMFRYMETPI